MSMNGLPPGPKPVAPVGDPDGPKRLYGDGRTKQAFAESTDINKILEKAQRTGSLSHLERHGAVYGDFSDVPDLLTAHNRIVAGQKVYDDLPSEVRKEFADMFEFFEYVNDPANTAIDPDTGRSKLHDLLPDLAKPGRQRPDVVRTAASAANPAIADSPPEVAPAAPEAPVEPSASSTT